MNFETEPTQTEPTQTEPTQTEPTHHTTSTTLVEVAALWLPLWCATVAIVLLGLNRIMERPLRLAGTLALLLTLIAGWLTVRNHKSTRTSVVSRLTLKSFLTEAAMANACMFFASGVLLARFHIALVPKMNGTDFSAHGGLVTWISNNERLPSVSRWPVGMANYPNAAHVVPALAAKLTPLRPLESLWLFSILAIFAQWPLMVLITRLCSRTGRWWVGLSCLVFLMLAYSHSAGLLTLDFYYAQAVGQWWAVAGIAFAVRGMAQRIPIGRWAPHAVTLGVGSLLAYPQGSVVILGAAIFAFFALRIRGRIKLSIAGIGLAFVALFVVAVSRTVYWNKAVFAGLPSNAPQIRVSLLGGVGTIGLAVLGLILLTAWVRKSRYYAPILGAVLAPLIVMGTMLSMRAGFPIRIPFTSYRLLKNVFGLVPFGAVCAAIGLELLATWLLTGFPRQRTWIIRFAPAVVTAVMVGSILSIHRINSSLRPMYSRDAYKLGLSLPHSVTSDLGLAGTGFGTYTLRWAGIGPMNEPNLPEDIPRSIRWEKWPDTSLSENYLLVSGPWVDRFVTRPGVRVLRRQGGAVLLERTKRIPPK
jgi:hypothetical protein